MKLSQAGVKVFIITIYNYLEIGYNCCAWAWRSNMGGTIDGMVAM